MITNNKVRKPLMFKNPVFNEDMVNLTVRRGTKHADMDDNFFIGDVDGEVIAIGELVDVKVLQFSDIEKEDLSFEHDPVCRDYEGLLEVMRDVYSDFDTYEIVTMLYFKVRPI